LNERITSSNSRLAYRRSNSLTKVLSKAFNMRRRWMNKVLHMPNSTSCMRSTTSMSNRLNPRGESLFEKAFCSHLSDLMCSYAHFNTYQCWYQGLPLQKVFDCSAIDSISFVVNNFLRGINFASPALIIDADKGFSLFHIAHHSEILKTGLRDKAPGTWTVSFVADACQKHSALIRN